MYFLCRGYLKVMSCEFLNINYTICIDKMRLVSCADLFKSHELRCGENRIICILLYNVYYTPRQRFQA